MQAQDESFKPKGRQFSFYGEALNSGKGAMWHGAFWAATGFLSCAAANRMMNRRAMTWPWMHVLMATGAGSLGASYGQWSQDTMFWIRRQKDALTRLPLWAQVVDDSGESVSDGSLQYARLQRLRDAIVAADEAEFLELGSEADAAKFLGDLQPTDLGRAAARSMASEEVIMQEAARSLGPKASQLAYALAMAPAQSRAKFFEAARSHIVAEEATTKSRPRSAEEVADTIMAKARLAGAVRGTRLGATFLAAAELVRDRPEQLEELPPAKQAAARQMAACVTRTEVPAIIAEEDGTKSEGVRPRFGFTAEAKQAITDAIVEAARERAAFLQAYATLGSDPAFYASQLSVQSKKVREELAARAAALKEVEDRAAAEEGSPASRGAAVAAEAAGLRARLEAQAKDSMAVQRMAEERMAAFRRELTTVSQSHRSQRSNPEALRALAVRWMTGEDLTADTGRV